MPDAQLSELAGRHELRRNRDKQLERMIADPRSDAFVYNFVGQWLQVRDIDGININERVVLARDRGQERQLEQRFKRFRELQAIPKEKRTPEEQAELQKMIDERKKRQNAENFELDDGLRRAMRQETEMTFGYVMHENRSVKSQLVQSDYTFLNAKTGEALRDDQRRRGADASRRTAGGQSARRRADGRFGAHRNLEPDTDFAR